MNKDIKFVGDEVSLTDCVYSGYSFDDGEYQTTFERDEIVEEASNEIWVKKTSVESKDRLRAVFDASHDGIFVQDEDKIVYTNNAYAHLLGYDTAEELLNITVSKMLLPEEAERMKKFGEARLSGKPLPSIYEFKAKRKDGSLIELEAAVSNSVVSSKTYLIANVRDLCGGKHTAQLFKENEERYRLLGDSILHKVWTADAEGKLDYVNQRTLEYFGLGMEAALKAAWQDAVHSDDLALCTERWENSLRTGKPYEVEFRMCGADGVYRWHLGRATAHYDASGKILKWFGTNTDIDDRKLAEKALIESEERLQQSQRMEAIGTLTGGVAHDFNNLLTAILGNAQLIMQRLDSDNPMRQQLAEIEKAGERAACLTRQLLAFSRRQHLERRTVNLNDTIDEITTLLERIIGEDVEVSVRRAADLSNVFADPAQIEQVIMNICVNARDAMPDGGRLKIETSNVELDTAYTRQYPYIQAGKYVQIRISDNGTGMNEETKNRIFEPFFTTKAVGKGTGLGLSMAYGIIKQHDGHINVYSENGYGTTFKIFLPAYEKKVEPKPPNLQLPLFGGTETILVAEDEEALRDLAKDVLSELGYTVLLAKNGEEAVKIYAENRERIDMLLFDVIMPRMGGSEAYEQIRASGSKVPLIFMTGYSSETVQSRFVKQNNFIDNPAATVIQKPYSISGLGHKVREVLDVRSK
ncbi:MAG: PAS domain S-box protein [Aridibacter sp.]